MKSLIQTALALLLMLAFGCVPLIRVEPQPLTFGEAFYLKEPAVVPELSDAWDCVLVPLKLGIVVPPDAPASLDVTATLLQGVFPAGRDARLTTASDLNEACARLLPDAGATSTTTVKVEDENVTDGLLSVTLYLVAKPGRPLEAGDLLELELTLAKYNGLTRAGLRLENGAHSAVGVVTGIGLIVVFTVVAAAL